MQQLCTTNMKLIDDGTGHEADVLKGLYSQSCETDSACKILGSSSLL